MTKKEIIGIVSSMEKIIEKDKRDNLFIDESKNRNSKKNTEKDKQDKSYADKNKDSKKIGCNQFRDIAALCKSADCFEEIEMLIRYNMAKCRSGESWMFNCGNGKLFGEIVLENMNEIKDADKEKDKEVLKSFELYFGYLYWQSRIWAVDSAS